MAESTPTETVYDEKKCLPEKKGNTGGPCIMKIQRDHKIIGIPTNRIVSKLRDLKSLSVWRSVPILSDSTDADFTELEHNLQSCNELTDESFELLERLIGAGESGDEAGTTDITVTEDNKTILKQCKLISDEELNQIEELLKIGGKRKSRKSKKARKSKKNKSKKSRKTRKSKSHKK
jgi:hypothetical protein